MTHRPRLLATTFCLLAVFSACTTGTSSTARDGGPSPGDADPIPGGCDASQDADGDGIADRAEGTFDADGDGTPNHLDTDSDGDGIPDAEEHGANPPCARPDQDGDGVPNWIDTDSDNDGLSDAEERSRYATDPYNRDSDGDGVTDLGEVRGTMTDPNDPTSTIRPEDFFVVLPYEGERVMRTLRFGTNIRQADVYFLIDTTGSMEGPIANVRSSLTRIAGELRRRIRDVQMGVGSHDDFPNGTSPFDFGAYGHPPDQVYENHQDITDDLSAVQNALNRLTAEGGGDLPESQVEALYQTATGEGGEWTFASGAPRYAIPRRRCPAVPDEIGMRRGYPCFRPGSLPIIVLVTDAAMHNGTDPMRNYVGITPPPHTLPQAVSALNRIGARVIGVAVDGGGRADMEAVSRMTGTIDGSGRPLVYDAAGGTVSDAIIEAMATLVGGTPQDVTTARENVPGNPDGIDATGFIKSIVTVEGYASDGRPGPRPGVSYERRDDTTFYAVVPGTTVEFAVEFHNDFVPPPVTAQIYRAVIVVIGNGVARLDERQVYIVVPPEGATILI
jgi:hypothetical protein